MKIVIINGVGASGKDEFIKQLEIISPYKVHNISAIERVKEIAKESFGWQLEKTNESRRLLADLKRVWIEYNNGPFNDIINKVKKFEIDSSEKDITFIHCREIDEIKKFKEYFKSYVFVTLLIDRDVPIPENYADAQVYDYEYDYYIKNEGDIEDLKMKAETFFREIIKK